MTDMMHIAMASNRRYLPGLRATMVSLIRAASEPTRMRFHVFSDGLQAEDQESLQDLACRFGYEEQIDFIVPNMVPLEKVFKAYNGSLTPFLRLFFPELLNGIDWVLWSDVDVLWFRDPFSLWGERDARFSVVWSQDIPSSRKVAVKQAERWRRDMEDSRYCCSGVMLMNLRRMRESGFVAKSIDFVSRWGSPIFADQDVLNEICYDDAKMVDRRWDLMYPIDTIGDGVVIHFNGIGPKFNDRDYSGFSPLYEIWFRHRNQIVCRQGRDEVCPLYKRALFWLMSSLYPMHRLIARLTDPVHPWVSDFIQRNLLFAWLRRKVLWK